MKNSIKLFSILFLIISLVSCKTGPSDQLSAYIPIDKELFAEINEMDQEFFEAYNNCDLEKQRLIYSDNIEFFHDKGGLMTSKEDILKSTEMNICGKVTRELIQGTVEVYPINKYGAVQIGFHKFHNNQEPNAESKPSKFIVVWRKSDGKWQMEKVISLH